ncbi:MAG: family NAD(P)-dependent oxidoreductase, partial [Acidimicrobiia bacterium]|nr:family NAD(P)-dependent oxidoreductase [Acidimicrobiia bacterium]
MAQLRFDGKVAIITGAGRGLGAQYARLLAARGASVVVNDAGVGVTGDATGESPADLVAQAISTEGGQAIADRHDVVSEADAVVAAALERFGRIDIVVNNAGITGGGPFSRLSAADFDQLFDIHFKGTVAVTRAAWPHLLSAGAGRLVNTSSPAIFGGQFISHYSSAKAATMAFTRVLAQEGARKGVTVNAVAPGASTRMTSFVPGALSEYVDEFLPTEDVANFVLWLLHESTSLTGETFSVGGGVARRIVLATNQGAQSSA